MSYRNIELPTNKNSYITLGLIITAYIGLILANKKPFNESIYLIALTIISYILSPINAKLVTVKSYKPKISQDYKNFITNEFGYKNQEQETKDDIIKTQININLGSLALILFSIYLLTKIDFPEFIMLFSISTLLYSYLARLEEGIGIISPFYAIFLIIPASIYLINNPGYLFFSSTIIGITLASIFQIKDLKNKNLYSVSIGGKGSFETYILIALVSIILL